MFQMPEEDSFAVLVKIMQDYRMREMFKPSMAELGLCMYQLDTLVQEHIPDLYVHFQSQVMLAWFTSTREIRINKIVSFSKKMLISEIIPNYK